MKDLKLIPFNELISKTQFTKADGIGSLAEASSRAVHVKDKLRRLYRSLNQTTSLRYNALHVATIVENLILEVGTKISKESDADGYYTIELTLLSDKGVKWLNEINSIVNETKNKTRERDTIDPDLEELMKELDEWAESEFLYED